MTQLGHTGRGNCAFVAPSAARCVTRAVRSAEWSLTRQPSIRIHDLWSRHVAQDGLLLGTTRRDTLHLCQFSLSLTTLRHCGQRQAHSTESQSSASTNLACLLWACLSAGALILFCFSAYHFSHTQIAWQTPLHTCLLKP